MDKYKMLNVTVIQPKYFSGENHDEKIFRYKVNYLWFFLAIIMFVMALVVIKTEIISSILFVLSGAIFFPGMPLVLKYYKKAYYIQMTDTYVTCSGRINNLFGKRKIMYQDICYQELAKAMEQLSSVSQSFQNSTQDSELLSRFNSYYTNLQFKYYYDALEIIELKPFSPALRNLNSSE